METDHRLIISDAREMAVLDDTSIDLIVTSPPYPMIKMWDDVFARLSPSADRALADDRGTAAFEAMHRVLDPVWQECFRVLRPGGFACINIGDATRTVNGSFALYPNHARIISAVQAAGFTVLPCILWRKQTNAPNKYMGSGMLPAGAYVTLEHEYILILRKGDKRVFKTNAQRRQESAIFWEERNLWFSDIWTDLKGSRQLLGKNAPRQRSGAFPFDLASRLIHMYSLKGDTVLDPFAGTGTTLAAAMTSARHSVGLELDRGLVSETQARTETVVTQGQALARRRLARHLAFTTERIKTRGPFKYLNSHYGFPVMTRQETGLLLSPPEAVTGSPETGWHLSHATAPDPDFCRDWEEILGRPDAEAQIRALYPDIITG